MVAAHIDWKKKRVPARTLGSDVMSHIDWEGEQNIIYKGVETFLTKPRRDLPIGEENKESYCLLKMVLIKRTRVFSPKKKKKKKRKLY